MSRPMSHNPFDGLSVFSERRNDLLNQIANAAMDYESKAAEIARVIGEPERFGGGGAVPVGSFLAQLTGRTQVGSTDTWLYDFAQSRITSVKVDNPTDLNVTGEYTIGLTPNGVTGKAINLVEYNHLNQTRYRWQVDTAAHPLGDFTPQPVGRWVSDETRALVEMYAMGVTIDPIDNPEAIPPEDFPQIPVYYFSHFGVSDIMCVEPSP